jgi:glycerol-3-phosphate acyltransferase PlsX
MMLDLGANVDCEPQHLLQFAEMGMRWWRRSKARSARRRPAQHRRRSHQGQRDDQARRRTAARQHAQLPRQRRRQRHLQGHGRHVVCDGFVGNVALKTSRRPRADDGDIIKEEFGRSWITKLAGAARAAGADAFQEARRSPPYNGAALLGLKRLVIKSHGSADAYAFEWAIKRGYDAVKMACWSAFARAMADTRCRSATANTTQAAQATRPGRRPSR